MLFQAVMKFLSRLFEFKILVNWGMVHCADSIDHKSCPIFSGLTNRELVLGISRVHRG